MKFVVRIAAVPMAAAVMDVRPGNAAALVVKMDVAQPKIIAVHRTLFFSSEWLTQMFQIFISRKSRPHEQIINQICGQQEAFQAARLGGKPTNVATFTGKKRGS